MTEKEKAKYYYLNGLAYYANGTSNIEDCAVAIENLEKAVTINPQYEKAYILLGVILSDNSNYQRAINNFNNAININKKNYKTYWRLAETYNRFEEYSEAKKSAKQSLKINHLLNFQA